MVSFTEIIRRLEEANRGRATADPLDGLLRNLVQRPERPDRGERGPRPERPEAAPAGAPPAPGAEGEVRFTRTGPGAERGPGADRAPGADRGPRPDRRRPCQRSFLQSPD